MACSGCKPRVEGVSGTGGEWGMGDGEGVLRLEGDHPPFLLCSGLPISDPPSMEISSLFILFISLNGRPEDPGADYIGERPPGVGGIVSIPCRISIPFLSSASMPLASQYDRTSGMECQCTNVEWVGSESSVGSGNCNGVTEVAGGAVSDPAEGVRPPPLIHAGTFRTSLISSNIPITHSNASSIPSPYPWMSESSATDLEVWYPSFSYSGRMISFQG